MAVLKKYSDMPVDLDELSKIVIDSVFMVHKELGPGYLERIYEEALIFELESRDIPVQRQQAVSVRYKGKVLPTEYKIDLMIDNRIILELKTVEKILPVHEAQIISNMKQSGILLGFIVNFNEVLIKNGIKRMVLSHDLRSFASSR